MAEREWTQEEIQAEIDAYDGAIAYLDQQIGLLFDELEKRNVLENTLVILTSDHGEEFGEHGFMEHGFTLYLPSVRVPLLVLFPGRVPAGTIVSEPVSLSDLPATVTDLVELESGPRFPGNSLARYWDAAGDDERPAASLALSELFGSYLPGEQDEVKKSLLVDGKHYIKNGSFAKS